MALDLEDRLAVARSALGRSVVAINPHAREQAARKVEGLCAGGGSLEAGACPPGASRLLTFGVKDHGAIPRELVRRLSGASDCLMLTVDHMADLGRSVDTELMNPLTYRPMTGSTSGGPINVLKGINDFCVGTDGGGSVLAPALATNLYAVMCKGLGLVADGETVSTDGLAFRGGIGFIGRSLEVLAHAAELAYGSELLSATKLPEVVVPAAGCATLPDGSDMRAALARFLGGHAPSGTACPVGEEFSAAEPFGALEPTVSDRLGTSELAVFERAFSNLYDREQTVRELGEIWQANPTTCVVTFEGPIDVLSADETIPRCFGGPAPEAVASVRAKAQVKAINIAGGSAFCIPDGELASGLVVSCGPGLEAFCGALRLTRFLEQAVCEVCPQPEIFSRYFLDRTKAPMPLDPCW